MKFFDTINFIKFNLQKINDIGHDSEQKMTGTIRQS